MQVREKNGDTLIREKDFTTPHDAYVWVCLERRKPESILNSFEFVNAGKVLGRWEAKGET